MFHLHFLKNKEATWRTVGCRSEHFRNLRHCSSLISFGLNVENTDIFKKLHSKNVKCFLLYPTLFFQMDRPAILYRREMLAGPDLNSEACCKPSTTSRPRRNFACSSNSTTDYTSHFSAPCRTTRSLSSPDHYVSGHLFTDVPIWYIKDIQQGECFQLISTSPQEPRSLNGRRCSNSHSVLGTLSLRQLTLCDITDIEDWTTTFTS